MQSIRLETMGQNPSHINNLLQEHSSEVSSASSCSSVDDEILEDAPDNSVQGKDIANFSQRLASNSKFKSAVSDLLSKKEKKIRTKPKFPFCTMSNLSLVPLHSDLVNEPWTKEDTGVRADVYPSSSRPFFKCQLAGGMGVCIAGNIALSIPQLEQIDKSWKIATTLSVIDVYDAYGLETAYSYLHHLYHLEISMNYPQYLALYLVGSLAILNPECATSMYKKIRKQSAAIVLAACSILLAELALLETKQPILSCSEITAHTTVLPIEILARIFNSKRISKQIAEQVTLQRRGRELRIFELQCRAIHPIISKNDLTETTRENRWQSVMNECNKVWLMEQRGDDFIVSSRAMGLADVMLSMTKSKQVLYSYQDYARMRNLPLKQVLSSMLREVDTKNEDMLCAWILMLCIENGDENELTIRRDQLLFSFEFLSKRALENASE